MPFKFFASSLAITFAFSSPALAQDSTAAKKTEVTPEISQTKGATMTPAYCVTESGAVDANCDGVADASKANNNIDNLELIRRQDGAINENPAASGGIVEASEDVGIDKPKAKCGVRMTPGASVGGGVASSPDSAKAAACVAEAAKF